MIKHKLGVGGNHDHSTGCLNDYMWDKRIIGASIRASFFCQECLDQTSPATKELSAFKVLMALLEYNAAKSRSGSDVLDLIEDNASTDTSTPKSQFDAFLCHNSSDKPAVRELNQSLKHAGIVTWLDEEQLRPGDVWQSELEKTIAQVNACVICVGPAGEGPWQEAERRAFIAEFVNRGVRVIPALLPGCSAIPDLPLFIRQFMWVDLRSDDGTQLTRLVNTLRP